MLKRVTLTLWLSLLAGTPLAGQARSQADYIAMVEGAGPAGGDSLSQLTIPELMKKYGVPGVSVAVIWNYQIHWAKGYGVADVQTGAPVNSETVFQAASISKPVAAMGVLKAVQDGIFGLDDDINRILTSWRLDGGDFTRNTPVTPRTLTSHVSGLGDAFGFPGYDPGVSLPTPVQILQGHSLSNVGPVFMEREPWAAFEYSGGGVTVMQVALSDARRRAFADLMRTDVLEPIGMTQSTFEQPLPPARDRNAARAHDGTGQAMGPKWHVYPELAAAGLWTTPTDLARFAIEVQQAARGKSSRVLSRATVQEMLTPVGVGSFAVGFSMAKEGEGWYFAHGGANWGFRADLRAHKVKGYGLAIMTNADRGGPVMAEIARRVKRAYGWDSETKPPPRGYDPPITTAPVTVPTSVLAEYVGTYRGPGFTFVVTLDGTALRVGDGGPQTMPLLAASETRFFAQNGLRLTFTRDGAGKVNGLTIRLSGRDVPIPRV